LGAADAEDDLAGGREVGADARRRGRRRRSHTRRFGSTELAAGIEHRCSAAARVRSTVRAVRYLAHIDRVEPDEFDVWVFEHSDGHAQSLFSDTVALNGQELVPAAVARLKTAGWYVTSQW
jgi:hypothetical protein